MVSRFRAGRCTLVLVAAACLLVAALPAIHGAASAPELGPREYGFGVLAVDGTAGGPFDLAGGGTYYLAVAPNSASEYVDARVFYNGTLAAELNESVPTVSFVSLSAGNYTIALSGHGHAALAWDLTNGSLQDFPASASVIGYLRPASTRLFVTVSMGATQRVHLTVYGDALLALNGTTVTSSGTTEFDLAASHPAYVLLEASVIQGSPSDVFGVAWSSPAPPNPGPDLGSQILTVVLWIAVPVVIALVAFVLLRRRGHFP